VLWPKQLLFLGPYMSTHTLQANAVMFISVTAG